MSRAVLLLLLAPVLSTVLAGPGPGPDDERENAPSMCPYCHGDPEVMQRAGIVSHGGFEFGAEGEDTASVDAFLGGADVYWIETAHFELGFGLGPYPVKQREKKKLRAELAKLAEVLPEVDPKTKVLDEWLRVHLFAQRCEEVWDRFLEIMQVEEGDFPTAQEPWLLGTPYFGEGPYVGQKGKYELLILETEADHVAFLTEHFGLNIKRTQRWNVIPRDTITVNIHVRQGDLRVDTALHGHVAFNLAHNLLDGYKHYSYDTPLWIHEGLAHFLEREVSIDHNSFDSTEGAVAEKTRKKKWVPEVKKLVQRGEAPRLAELVNIQSYAAFGLEHHYTTWSMVDFLIGEHADGFACLNDRLHGRKTEEGLPDGSNLRDVHRDAFQECLGMSYAQFDQAWRDWVGALEDRPD